MINIPRMVDNTEGEKLRSSVSINATAVGGKGTSYEKFYQESEETNFKAIDSKLCDVF